MNNNFKKLICIALSFAVLLTLLGTHAFAKDITVKLDGEVVDCPVAAKIENGSTMVPMRAIFEAFGMEVNWDEGSKTVTAQKGDKVIKLTVGENYLYCNGEQILLNAAPYIENGTTMVPVRAISECLEAKVTWHNFIKQVDIVTNELTIDPDAWKENVGTINLTDLTVTGLGVQVSENVVYITSGGDFEVTGENDNAMIYVNTLEKVKLRLSGVKLTNTSGPAIFFDNTEKALITISKGTENYITDGEEYTVDAKAAIFSNDDIEIKGEGTLTVTSKAKHAIASDDDIKIEEGTIVLLSEKSDGIHANNTVKILGGNINITALGDGIQAEEDVIIENGSINVTTNGTDSSQSGAQQFGGRGGRQIKPTDSTNTLPAGNITPPEGFNGEKPMEERGGKPMGQMPENMGEMTPPEGFNGEKPEERGGGPMGQMPENIVEMTPSENATQEADETASTKGIKAETDITISGGTITVNSADHAIHSAAAITISGGEMNLTSQKGKGISAHGEFVINDGVINVLKSTEGLEAKANFTINGGTISITASDDGINAGGTAGRDVAGGKTEESTGHDLTINGGKIYVNASGDGLDANGKMIIAGGDIIVEGPTNSGNGALDSGGVININGGTLIALGASGMAEMPNSASKQPSFRLVTETNIPEGSIITITNSKGEAIYSYTTVKTGNSIVFSSDKLIIGETYSVRVGESDYSLTMDNTVTTIGTAAGGFGGKRW